MAWFDWLFGRKTETPQALDEADPGEPGEQSVNPPAPAESKPVQKAPKKAKKHHRKKRKNQEPPPPRPTAEVLSREEAERRYAHMFEAKEAPKPAPTTPKAPAVASAIEPNPAPVTKPPEPKPKHLGPRAQREATRAWAVVPLKHKLLEEMDQALTAKPPLPRLRAMKKRLKREWSELGAPPPEEREALGKALQQRFDAIEEHIAAHLAVAEAKAHDAVNQREALLKEAEAALAIEDLQQARQALKEVDARWRKEPRLDAKHFRPLKKQWDEVWRRMNGRSDEARQATQAQFQERLERRKGLVAQAEGLTQAKDAHQATERMKALQAQWKEVGFCGKGPEVDALWKQFRGAADQVFERRRQMAHEQHQQNLEKKQSLVDRAILLAHEGVDDPEPILDELHEAWKEIGHVPKRDADQLWNAFRKACKELRGSPAAGHADKEESLRYNPFAGLGGD